MRIYTLEEKPILAWTYANISESYEWYNKSKSDDEAENKILMRRIILADKQAGAQSAVGAYFISINDEANIQANTMWFTVDTALQWHIYLKFYGAAIDSKDNPHLTMGERLALAMQRVPKIGEDVTILSKAVEKGIIDLNWEDYIVDNEGRRRTNPKNSEVIKTFLSSLKDDAKN